MKPSEIELRQLGSWQAAAYVTPDETIELEGVQFKVAGLVGYDYAYECDRQQVVHVFVDCLAPFAERWGHEVQIAVIAAQVHKALRGKTLRTFIEFAEACAPSVPTLPAIPKKGK